MAFKGLSPALWDNDELKRFQELNNTWGRPDPFAESSSGIVTGTNNAFAVRAGVEALRQGGTAADAVCTGALVQVALSAGATVSYAGNLHLVYFESKSGKTFAIDGSYMAPKEETDPISIPKPPTPSGRSVLVPGFMRALETAHQRFGTLPFSELFEPAIYIAKEGFEVSRVLEGWIRSGSDVLNRRDETRAVFSKSNGSFYQTGDRFCQPQLAETLRAVASTGADYMYDGPWAEKLVESARAEGGKITTQDLADYQAILGDPLQTTYRGLDIAATPTGINALEGLNLMELAAPQNYGHYAQSAEALYWLIQITRLSQFITSDRRERLDKHFPDLSFTPESRATKPHAEALWEKLKKPGWFDEFRGFSAPSQNHSAGLIAVDAMGNVAALGHSINTILWGKTGIFIDGISIPDSGAFNQHRMHNAGPYGRIRNSLNPLIVHKNGKPLLASSAINPGMNEVTIQRLHSILDFGMDFRTSIETPIFHAPMRGLDSNGKSRHHLQAIPPGTFSEDVLQGVQNLGQPIEVLSPRNRQESIGLWIGVSLDQERGQCIGCTLPNSNGLVMNDEQEI